MKVANELSIYTNMIASSVRIWSRSELKLRCPAAPTAGRHVKQAQLSMNQRTQLLYFDISIDVGCLYENRV